MKRLSLALLGLALAGCQPRPVNTIHDARVVVTGTGAAVYATIDDKGGGDRLVEVELDGIGRAPLHDMRIENGVMKMREVPGGFAVPAGGQLRLAPMGKHAMIESMANPPRPGTTIPLTFSFTRQLRVHTTAKVESGTAMAM
ncbi:copper chaperone PCu(A)C [Sphingomonas sp. ASV193]|uniref:copper chaperone PCu(A)C n=1 Tax=Sphingomonas sp. ASV193 TaxID=3144405 RepID=UPI0032E86D31